MALAMSTKQGKNDRRMKDSISGGLPINTRMEAGNRKTPYHSSLGDRAKTVDEDVASHVHRWA